MELTSTVTTGETLSTVLHSSCVSRTLEVKRHLPIWKATVIEVWSGPEAKQQWISYGTISFPDQNEIGMSGNESSESEQLYLPIAIFSVLMITAVNNVESVKPAECGWQLNRLEDDQSSMKPRALCLLPRGGKVVFFSAAHLTFELSEQRLKKAEQETA